MIFNSIFTFVLVIIVFMSRLLLLNRYFDEINDAVSGAKELQDIVYENKERLVSNEFMMK